MVCLPLFFASVALGAADPEIRVVSHFVTSGQSLQHAKRAPMKIFSSQDSVISFVNFQWDPMVDSVGKRTVTWNWFSNGRLVSTARRTLEFRHPPYYVWSKREASALGNGPFTVQVYVDSSFVASDKFTIKN